MNVREAADPAGSGTGPVWLGRRGAAPSREVAFREGRSQPDLAFPEGHLAPLTPRPV